MINSFFTPEEINSRQKSPYHLHLTESYDFGLLQQDVFQIVSPHVESISDRKHKIVSWLKKAPLIERMSILTYTNKEFVCMIRAMYEKKQKFDCIHHFTYPINFDLLSMINTKKLSSQYLATQDQLLVNIQIMSRYTQFDSITFNQNSIRNVQPIFHWFEILGNGIAYELTLQQYQKLRSQPNSLMFYDPSEQHCYKKAPLGTWITQVFMKHISMKYLEYQLSRPAQIFNGIKQRGKQLEVNGIKQRGKQLEINDLKQRGKQFEINDIKQRSKQFEKYWKIITAERKNAIIKKVLQMKPIDLYQEHRSMIKVTRNGFPPIQKSDNVPLLLKNIVNSNEKEIFKILFYTNINETLQSHSVLKYYITLELQDQIKQYNLLQQDLSKINKMKKKTKQKNLQTTNKFKNQSKEHKIVSNIQTSIIFQNTLSQQKQNYSINGTKKQMEGQKIIVKGTDLFYKKLEVSSTQQIFSFQGNFDPSPSNTQEKIPIQISLKESKQKKNKKNKKKKKKNKVDIGSKYKTQDDIQKPASDLNENFISSNEPNIKIVEKNMLRKSSSILFDKSSQKSSETTNDQADLVKEQNNELQVKIGQKEFELKNCDPLDIIYKDLQKRISFYNKQRKIVINRLMNVFAQHKLSFKVYGSSCCDAALPTSDIDIVVDPSIVDYFFFSYANYKKKIINSLEYLQKVFQKFQWAADFILLAGANIPLLTFTVNPGIQFDIEHSNYLYNNRKQLKEEIKISVDITIQPYVNMIDQVPMHLGVESSQLMKQWISMFPFYLQLLILLKIFTKNQNLNKSYHGGISSFMQAVMLADFYKNICLNLNLPISQLYIKKQKLAEIMPSSWNLSKLFLLYCQFINQFDEQKQILDVNSDRKKTYKEPTILKEQFCIINPLTGKIMSERCTLFPDYKKLITEFCQRMNSKEQTSLDQYLLIVFEA